MAKRNGLIEDKIKKKYVKKTPEEIVRQDFIEKVLVKKFGYKYNQICEELKIKAGRGAKRADIVVYRNKQDKEEQKKPYIVVEVKAENVPIDQEAYDQGEYYARTTGAKYLVLHNFKETKYYIVEPYPKEEIIEIGEEYLPRADEDEEFALKKARTSAVFQREQFGELLHQCHNKIRNAERYDPAKAFDEISKVLFMKVMREREYIKGESERLTKENVEKGERTLGSNYLEQLFEKTKKIFEKDKIFDSEEKINLKTPTIKTIIELLEDYDLSHTADDVKGIAFERFLGRTFRGDIGQFFTPREIVNFMVAMLDPKESEKIVDPASGSGGFIIRFFEVVRDKIEKDIRKQLKLVEQGKLTLEQEEKLKNHPDLMLQNKEGRVWKLANECIFGIDANDRMARTSKMNMIMHGDGHGGIHHGDGLLDIDRIHKENFDIVLTNPPFGANVEKEDIITKLEDEYFNEIHKEKFNQSVLEEFDLGATVRTDKYGNIIREPRNRQRTEILFLERCLQLLKLGGRMGIVLPDGVLNNAGLKYVRDYAESKAKILAIISLPQHTFVSVGSGVKTSLLFLKKFTEKEAEEYNQKLIKIQKEVNLDEKIPWDGKEEEIKKRLRKELSYPIFMSLVEHVGYLATGKTDPEGNELMNIENPDDENTVLGQFRKFLKDQRNYKGKE